MSAIATEGGLEEYLRVVEEVLREGGAEPSRLGIRALARYSARPVVAAVRFRAAFSDGVDRDLDVLVPRGGHRRAPLVAIVDPPPFLTWPHVERDGVLCLTGVNDGVRIDDSAALVRRIVSDASSLLDDCISGRVQADFLSEANSYWDQDSASTPLALSLVDLRPPTRLVHFFRTNTTLYVGDDPDAVRAWVRNFFADQRKVVDTSKCLFLWMPRPLYPAEFPRRAADLYALVSREAPTVIGTLDEAASRQEAIPIILAAPTGTGPFLGCVLVTPPTAGRASDPTLRGFRPGKVPAHILRTRFFGPNPTTRCRVERVDPAWIHGRTFDGNLNKLRDSRVTVIGCGSVGAHVAVALAQAGVQSFLLVDPEPLTAGNTYRHPLGARYIAQNKAVALAVELRRRFPHLDGVTAQGKRWELLDADVMSAIKNSNLIVAATGDTGSELTLSNHLRSTGASAAMVCGWLEEYAAAAHAVVVGSSGPCLGCHFDVAGMPAVRATQWQATTLRPEPACGATFQPYGAVELLNGVALISETALDTLIEGVNPTHRVRVVAAKRLKALGGKWTEPWLAATRREEGDFTWEGNSEISQGCGERH